MITVWRFSDGKRGHDNQTLGLVEALCRLAPCRVETVAVGKGWPYLFAWLAGRFRQGVRLPKPDLIIGAGHATHWPMLAARRAHGGRICVLMKPSLPFSWFDWVIAPAHDFPDEIPPGPPLSRGEESSLTKEGENGASRGNPPRPPFIKGGAKPLGGGERSQPGDFPLDKGGGEHSEPGDSPLDKGDGEHREPGDSPLDKGGGEHGEPGDFPGDSPAPSRAGHILLTLGPINRIKPQLEKNPQLGLFLIGGPSAEYGWHETALLKQIHLIALHEPQVTWRLTSSRRTPQGFLADLSKLDLSNVVAVAHDAVDANWLPEQLAQASQVWVTPDSASMVYEALTSGAAVGCFDIPFLRPGRVARGLQKLIRDGLVTAFSDWERSGKLAPRSQALNEAERCAAALLQWLKKS